MPYVPVVVAREGEPGGDVQHLLDEHAAGRLRVGTIIRLKRSSIDERS